MRFAMASIAVNLRSTCGSERKPPECSTQGFRAAQPQVGHGTESICLSVRSFLFIETDSDNALYKCAKSLRRVQSANCNRSSQIQKAGNHAATSLFVKVKRISCQVYIRDCQGTAQNDYNIQHYRPQTICQHDGEKRSVGRRSVPESGSGSHGTGLRRFAKCSCCKEFASAASGTILAGQQGCR